MADIEFKGKKKIGARPLLKDEVELILPTYNKILTQIDEIREESTRDNEKSKQTKNKEMEQKTNNIGILGARGTGKTSVLKTIKNYLLNQDEGKNKKRNIILPMIVPENMSESMSLMSTILGLFKKEVDQIVEKHNDRKLECWENKQLDIQKSYEELVKKYCFIQKEFRSIIVQGYTTENQYSKKSAEVFNSDLEFSRKLNDFIDKLIEAENCSEDAMIFMFIDDIDLSTHRCTNVVKTLLSYISHPRIITFISGDLNTFEEALTLDFLRQENSLSGELLGKEFMQKTENSTLLERKKLLSYEYLKKIVPPVYRHTVKNWSLGDRGNYVIEDNTENKDAKDKSMSLAELLTQTFRDSGCAAYFQYYDYNDMVKDEKGKDTEQPKLKNIPQVFHIFDNTARGLNNVYNLLLSLYEEKRKGSISFESIKVFLETIVASNKVLSDYRDLLLQSVIQFGNNFDTTIVRCDNLFDSVFKTHIVNVSDKSQNKQDKENNQTVYQVENPVHRFTLFIFIDFAIRILYQNIILESSDYNKLRKHAIVDLLNYPVISDSTKSIDECKKLDTSDIDKILRIDFFNGNSFGDFSNQNGKELEQIIDSESRLLAFESELIFILQYIQFIQLEKLLTSIIMEIKQKKDKEIYPYIIEGLHIKSYYALNSIKLLVMKNSKKNMIENDILVLYCVLKAIIILAVFNNYSTNEKAYLIQQIFGKGKDNIVDKIIEKYSSSMSEEEKQKCKLTTDLTQHKYLIYNTLSALLESIFTDDGKLKSTEFLKGKVLDEQYEAIKKIDELSVWNTEVKEIVEKYITQIIKQYLNNISDWAVELDNIIPSFKEFENSYDGWSSTGSCQLKCTLRSIFKPTFYSNEYHHTININDYLRAIGGPYSITYVKYNNLTINGYNNNGRIQYGKPEVRKMVLASKSLKLLLKSKYDFAQVLPWFYCYALIKANTDLVDIQKESTISSKLSRILGVLSIKQAENEFDAIKNQLDFGSINKAFNIDNIPNFLDNENKTLKVEVGGEEEDQNSSADGQREPINA